MPVKCRQVRLLAVHLQVLVQPPWLLQQDQVRLQPQGSPHTLVMLCVQPKLLPTLHNMPAHVQFWNADNMLPQAS